MVSRELSKGKSSLLYHLQGESVGKVKAWLLKMQEEADLAIEAGATTSAQVLTAMRTAGMGHIDEGWVERYCYKIFGPLSKSNRRNIKI